MAAASSNDLLFHHQFFLSDNNNNNDNNNPFFSDNSYSRAESLAFIKALKSSLSEGASFPEAAATSSVITEIMPTPTSGSSDPETAAVSKTSNNQNHLLGPMAARKKRKSRASKKFPTTIIAADAANFRRMVQEVTGVKFMPGSIGQVVRPEPVRAAVARGSVYGGGLPTLDTSSALLLDDDYSSQKTIGGCEDGIGFGDAIAAANGGRDFAGFHEVQFDGFIAAGAFPTLESWEVV